MAISLHFVNTHFVSKRIFFTCNVWLQ